MSCLIEVWGNMVTWVMDLAGFLRHRRSLQTAERAQGWWLHGMLLTVVGIFVLGWLLHRFLP